MKCNRCGAEIKSTLKFCNKCGAKIAVEEVEKKGLDSINNTPEVETHTIPVKEEEKKETKENKEDIIETLADSSSTEHSDSSFATNKTPDASTVKEQPKNQFKLFGFRSGKTWKKVLSVLYIVFCGLILLSIVTTEKEVGLSTQDYIVNQIGDFLIFLVMVSPYIFLSNSCLRDKLPIFKKKTILFDILGIILFAIIVLVVSSIIDGAHTEEYKNLITDNSISAGVNDDYDINSDSNELNSSTNSNGQNSNQNDDLNSESDLVNVDNGEVSSDETNTDTKQEEPTYQYVLDEFESELFLLDYYRQITYARENNISVIRFPKQEKELFEWLSEIHTDGCYLDFTTTNDDIHAGLNEGYYRKVNKNTDLYYIGEMHGNKPHGKGILYSRSSYELGTVEFDGEWFNIAYVGWFSNGSFDGFGLLYNETQYLDYLDDNLLKVYETIYSEFGNMVSYFGMFSNGVRSGLGNQFYELSINNIDERDGTFEYRFYNVNIGEFSDDVLNGNGKSYYDGFMYYEGGFKNGVIHGFGKLYYFISDILQYEGEFELGYKSGTGVAYSREGEVIHNGQWEFDEPKY